MTGCRYFFAVKKFCKNMIMTMRKICGNDDAIATAALTAAVYLPV